jgi:hypothetical protein
MTCRTSHTRGRSRSASDRSKPCRVAPARKGPSVRAGGLFVSVDGGRNPSTCRTCNDCLRNGRHGSHMTFYTKTGALHESTSLTSIFGRSWEDRSAFRVTRARSMHGRVSRILGTERARVIARLDRQSDGLGAPQRSIDWCTPYAARSATTRRLSPLVPRLCRGPQWWNPGRDIRRGAIPGCSVVPCRTAERGICFSGAGNSSGRCLYDVCLVFLPLSPNTGASAGLCPPLF